MKLVVIESPYAGNIEKNVKYARECLKHSLARSEAPIASHLLYTQPGVLSDNIPGERAKGINAGLAWVRLADAHVFYTDHGWSSGMINALKFRFEMEWPMYAKLLLRNLWGETKLPLVKEFTREQNKLILEAALSNG